MNGNFVRSGKWLLTCRDCGERSADRISDITGIQKFYDGAEWKVRVYLGEGEYRSVECNEHEATSLFNHLLQILEEAEIVAWNNLAAVYTKALQGAAG